MAQDHELATRVALATARKVTPYTAEEREAFRPDASAVVVNLFCKGTVKTSESEPGFVGWVVMAAEGAFDHKSRPLSVNSDQSEDAAVLAFGSNADVFPSYGMAVDVCLQAAAKAERSQGFWPRRFFIFGLRKQWP